MKIKSIKGNGVKVVDEIRKKITFTYPQRKQLEKLYKSATKHR